MSGSDVRIRHAGTTLAGTLHLPGGAGPHPALVMLQGSGADDRDSWGYFIPIREAFIGAGLAVLSWDKPGIGASTGDWHEQTFFDRADEALGALTWLRSRPEIDAARTGVWGHSQGGWIAQIIASTDPALAFAIVNSGPGIDVAEQDLFGIEHTLRRDGASEEAVRHARSCMERIHHAARAAMPYDAFVREVLAPARGTPGFDYFGEVDAGMWGFLVRNLARPYDPVAALERIRCPLLAIFDERDVLVPAAESARIVEQALARAGNANVTIRIFPGADHRIRTGDPARFAGGYLDTMTTWLRRKTREIDRSAG